MHLTLFITPVITHLLRMVSKIFLVLTGWKAVGEIPKEKKYIILGAPHTSNWDMPYMIACGSLLRVNPYWMGKHTLFKAPLGWCLKWLGGVSVDRTKRNSVVDQMVEIFEKSEELCLVISPEGTRSLSKKWKSGFYHIAMGAKIPLILGFVDYDKGEGGFGELFWPTGDIDADMKYIQEYYATKTGQCPENFGGDFLED